MNIQHLQRLQRLLHLVRLLRLQRHYRLQRLQRPSPTAPTAHTASTASLSSTAPTASTASLSSTASASRHAGRPAQGRSTTCGCSTPPPNNFSSSFITRRAGQRRVAARPRRRITSRVLSPRAGPVNDLWLLDPAALAWTPLSPLVTAPAPAPRKGLALVALAAAAAGAGGGGLFLFGGSDDSGPPPPPARRAHRIPPTAAGGLCGRIHRPAAWRGGAAGLPWRPGFWRGGKLLAAGQASGVSRGPSRLSQRALPARRPHASAKAAERLASGGEISPGSASLRCRPAPRLGERGRAAGDPPAAPPCRLGEERRPRVRAAAVRSESPNPSCPFRVANGKPVNRVWMRRAASGGEVRRHRRCRGDSREREGRRPGALGRPSDPRWSRD